MAQARARNRVLEVLVTLQECIDRVIAEAGATTWIKEVWKELRRRMRWASKNREFTSYEGLRRYVLKTAREVAISLRLVNTGLVPGCFENAEAAEAVFLAFLATFDETVVEEGGKEIHSAILEEVCDEFVDALTSRSSPMKNRTPAAIRKLLVTITKRSTWRALKKSGSLVDKEAGETAPVFVPLDRVLPGDANTGEPDWSPPDVGEVAENWVTTEHPDLAELLSHALEVSGPDRALDILDWQVDRHFVLLAELLLRPKDGIRDGLIEALGILSATRRAIILTRAHYPNLPWSDIRDELGLSESVDKIRLWFWRDCGRLRRVVEPVLEAATNPGSGSQGESNAANTVGVVNDRDDMRRTPCDRQRPVRVHNLPV